MAQVTEFVTNHLFLAMTFIGLFALLIIGEIRGRTSGVGTIGPMDATRLINHSNAIVLDVRESKETQDGTIINSIHIPLADLQNQLKRIEKYKEKPVIAYCRSGHRSANACSTLRKHGFTQVYNLRGGIMAWQKDNLPLVK
jgi:rhodanese-related sulfurtransferase